MQAFWIEGCRQKAECGNRKLVPSSSWRKWGVDDAKAKQIQARLSAYQDGYRQMLAERASHTEHQAQYKQAEAANEAWCQGYQQWISLKQRQLLLQSVPASWAPQAELQARQLLHVQRDQRAADEQWVRMKQQELLAQAVPASLAQQAEEQLQREREQWAAEEQWVRMKQQELLLQSVPASWVQQAEEQAWQSFEEQRQRRAKKEKELSQKASHAGWCSILCSCLSNKEQLEAKDAKERQRPWAVDSSQVTLRAPPMPEVCTNMPDPLFLSTLLMCWCHAARRAIASRVAASKAV